MKFLILIASLLVLVNSSPPLDKIHIPEKCSDVLAVKVCNKLSETAKNLKLSTDEVLAGIVEAVKSGKKKSEDIYDSAKDFLQKKVLSKSCEDFTTVDNCAKLQALAVKLAIKTDEVKQFVIQAIADGAVQANDVYQKVIEFYKTEVSTKTCEDFLTKAQCEKIREVAATLKLKVDDLEKTIVETVTKAYIEGKDAVKETFEYFKALAMNTSCEDLLNPDVCIALRKYAKLTKVAFPKIMEAAVDAIIKGYKLGKGLLKVIYDVTDYFYDCEDVFTKNSCDRLKSWLGKLGVKVTEIDRIVREYAKKGIATATELYTKIYDFLKEKVICKINPSCKSSSVVKRSIDTEALKKIAKEIAAAMAKAKKAIEENAKKVAEKMKEANEKMKKAIEETLLKMKMKSAQIAKFIRDFFAKMAGNKVSKRDIYQQLQEALQKAHGFMKDLIQRLMTMSKEHLKTIHTYVKSIFDKLLGDGKGKREIDEIDMMEEVVEKMIDEEFSEIEQEVEEDADVIIDEAILEQEDDEEIVEKRDLTNVTAMYKKFAENFKRLLEKVKGINIEDLMKMLKSAATKMLGSVKDLHEKIKKMHE